MTKQEFLKQKRDLLNLIEDAKESIKKLRDEYVSENQTLSIGTKVKVTYNGYKDAFTGKYIDPKIDHGWVAGYEESIGDVRIILHKLKKDGTPGGRRLYVYNGVIEELI